MKKSLALFIFAGLLPGFCTAQSTDKFTGEWEGILNAGIELRIVFHIRDNGKQGLSSTADSPDQSAYGLTCDTTFLQSGHLNIEMRNLQASFSGSLVNDSTIEGEFRQSGSLPLTLHRQKEKQATGVNQSTATLSFRVIDVEIPLKDVTLSGTCFQPLNDDKSKAVLIIAGSGPTDRDGNSGILPGKNNSLLQLADSLATHGIASLRYDKRAIGKSRLTGDLSEEDILFDDIAGDAQAMYEWLKKQGYKKIFIAGHSEGSLVGMLTAGKVHPAGFISIAGAGRKAGEILEEQIGAQASPSLKAEFARAIDSLERGLTVKKVHPALLSLLRPSIQPYMKSWLPLDPAKLIAGLKCPVLIIQGTKDLQVKETDANILYAAQPNAVLAVIPGMNHVLKEVEGDLKADNIKTYSNPDLPLARELVKRITAFIYESMKRK